MLAFAISLLAKGFRYTMLLINSVVYRKPLTSKDAFGMAYIASAFNAQFVDLFPCCDHIDSCLFDIFLRSASIPVNR